MSRFAVGSEIRRFSEQTTVRGVPRAARRSISRVLRGIWIVALAVSLSITCWQLYSVVVKYTKYKTDTRMKEALHKTIFPWVTVCNESPPTDGTFMYNWTEFKKNLETFTTMFNLFSASSYLHHHGLTMLPDGMTNEDAETFIHWYGSSYGFLSNLPLPSSPPNDSSSDFKTPFIVDCNYFDFQLNTFTDDVISCLGTVQIVYDPYYYRCFSFRPSSADLSDKIRGLTAIFYLDDFASAEYNYFTSDVRLSQTAGIRLSVHAPGTGSKIQMAEKVGPGKETLVHIRQTKYVRLPEPYGTCSNQLNLSSVEVREGDTVYTIDTCFGFCMQKVFIDRCRCLDTEHPFYQVDIINKSNCFNEHLFDDAIIHTLQSSLFAIQLMDELPQWVIIMWFNQIAGAFAGQRQIVVDDLQRGKCLVDVRRNLSGMLTACNCPKPCSEYTYAVTTIGSPWPHHSYQLAFYIQHIAPHPEIYGNKFDEYAEIQADVGNVSDAEIIKRLDGTSLMLKNFIRVSVLFDSYSSIEIVESASMTVDQLTSSIGGALSLWMGITTIFIIEVIDLLYSVFNVIFNIYKTLK